MVRLELENAQLRRQITDLQLQRVPVSLRIADQAPSGSQPSTATQSARVSDGNRSGQLTVSYYLHFIVMPVGTGGCRPRRLSTPPPMPHLFTALVYLYGSAVFKHGPLSPRPLLAQLESRLRLCVEWLAALVPELPL
jgi:hypothetical protein